MFDHELFEEARKEFLSYLLYTKGRSKATCYVYRSDIGIWGKWLVEAGKDWLNAKYTDVEQFAATLQVYEIHNTRKTACFRDGRCEVRRFSATFPHNRRKYRLKMGRQKSE